MSLGHMVISLDAGSVGALVQIISARKALGADEVQPGGARCAIAEGLLSPYQRECG